MNSREEMHYAQCLAGEAFSNALLGIVHSLAHKTGAAFSTGHIPHGEANAIYTVLVVLHQHVGNFHYQAASEHLHGGHHFATAQRNGLHEDEEALADHHLPAALHVVGRYRRRLRDAVRAHSAK